MSAHTPGPWTMEKYAPFGWAIRGAREPSLGAGTLICQLQGYGADADARLVAAAPELLDFAETFLAGFLDHDTPDSFLERMREEARAAIAKARGTK